MAMDKEDAHFKREEDVKAEQEVKEEEVQSGPEGKSPQNAGGGETHVVSEEKHSEAGGGTAADSGGEDEDEVEDEGAKSKGTPKKSKEEDEVTRLARAFFSATTKLSQDIEDILPQEDSNEMKLSVFNIFASLFPEVVGEHGAEAKNKKKRLRFNRIGYQIYGKEQSRRVPAVRAKPGNPGYGFRRARWREPLVDEEDRECCDKVLKAAGCDEDRIKQVKDKVQEICRVWDSVRRPSRPAGPGRPRRTETSPQIAPDRPSWASPTLESAGPSCADTGKAATTHSVQEAAPEQTKEPKKEEAGKARREDICKGKLGNTKPQDVKVVPKSTSTKSHGVGKRPRNEGPQDKDNGSHISAQSDKEPARKKPDTGTKQSPCALKDTQPPMLPPLALPPLKLACTGNMSQVLLIPQPIHEY
mmetsp:Transcript_18181/g.28203  ORF Transcript_18181/g.28203 Transcript_18181/m.28203 type:complete len:415 (+) Transcript_18181:215-1459(+)